MNYFFNNKNMDKMAREAGRVDYGEGALVKENVVRASVSGVVGARWLAAAAAAGALALLAAAAADARLPEPLPRDAPPERFSAARAYDHLVNLTAIGPRVAGSYENEVVAVRVLVEALRGVAAAASAHNTVDIDVFSASGAFSLTFLDGMSNVYRDVQGVVARARSLPARAGTPALLINCHYDTVPDSPGASDDAAGCAVGLETLRALAAGAPLRHDVLLLLNGAEENILQASHAFVTTHRWARAARAVVNVEACGAGGREVLFQGGPEPRLLHAYAALAPHPFASSLAQELFESGLVPADTDFRIFRDFGNLSGIDLAWSSNGYVYHTRLDTEQHVSRAVLQRTGDNVLALVKGVLAAGWLGEAAPAEGAPVYSDVLGVRAVCVRPGGALLLAAAALLCALGAAAQSARSARAHLCLSASAWARVVALAGACVALSALAGLAAALAPALLLHAAGARMSFYARPWLLLPLYAAPALAGAAAAARASWQAGAGRLRLAGAVRGWWAARAIRDAQVLWAGGALALGAALRMRSSFVPLLWTLPACGALLAHGARGAHSRWVLAAHALAAALPAAHTAYLALGCLQMFVPVMGRAGTAPAPDALMALLVAALAQLSLSWALPLVLVTRRPGALLWTGAGACAAAAVLALLGAPYSAARPQRVMVFHTRRTAHAPGSVLAGDAAELGGLTDFEADAPVASPTVETYFWLPELDVNTPHSLDDYVAGARAAQATPAAECARWPYCGAPYYLPVLSLVARGHRLAAGAAPPARLQLAAWLSRDEQGARVLQLRLRGPSHVVVVLAPAEGVRVAHCDVTQGPPQPGPAWGARRTYFLALHDARRPALWRLACRLERDAPGPPPRRWVQVSAAGHAMSGARHAEHAHLLAAMPVWTAPTGWPVDLHLATL